MYYIPPRYPNGFASGKPADYFSEKQGREAINAANSIIRFCEAIWLDRNQLLEELKTAAKEAKDAFPEIKEIRLFGSLARNEETGLSDVDIFIVAETEIKNPIERIKPYFCFFF